MSGTTPRLGHGVLLALLFLAVVAPWMKHVTAQPASRIALTAAIVDHGTIRIDRYERLLSADRIDRDGHVYSDKPPGQPLYAVPFYAVARAAGAEPAAELGFRGGAALWWVSLWSAVLPGAILVLLVHRWLAAAHPGAAVPATLAVGFGSLVLPFSAELYGHVLATVLGLAAWLVARQRPQGRWPLLGLGALLGAAVAVEYQMVLLVLIVLGAVAWDRRRSLPWVVLGGLPFVALLLAYQRAAFGSPFESSYAGKGGSSTVAGLPDPLQAVEVLVGTRGLFVFSPILLLGLGGLVALARRPGADRRDAVVGLLVFLAYWGLQAGWVNPWGGEMPGPRYMIPAIPMLGLGVAVVWPRLRTLSAIALVGSMAAMSLPLVTLHLVPARGGPVFSHIDNIRRFGVADTVWTELLGPAGWLLHVATVSAVAVALARSVPSDRARPPLVAAADGAVPASC